MLFLTLLTLTYFLSKFITALQAINVFLLFLFTFEFEAILLPLLSFFIFLFVSQDGVAITH